MTQQAAHLGSALLRLFIDPMPLALERIAGRRLAPQLVRRERVPIQIRTSSVESPRGFETVAPIVRAVAQGGNPGEPGRVVDGRHGETEQGWMGPNLHEGVYSQS